MTPTVPPEQAAWSRVEAALRDQWSMPRVYQRAAGVWMASCSFTDREVMAAGPTPAEALNALAEKLEQKEATAERETDLIFDQDGYPTEATLDAIREWGPPYEPLFDRLGELWRWRDDFRRSARGRNGQRTYRVSTGGWSGHESVIGAMQDNFPLWVLCWWSSRRGGHYVFRVPSGLHS